MKKILLIAAVAICAMGCCKKSAKCEGKCCKEGEKQECAAPAATESAVEVIDTVEEEVVETPVEAVAE